MDGNVRRVLYFETRACVKCESQSSDPVVQKPREYLSSECLSSISDIRLSDTLTTVRRQRVKLVPGVTMIVRNSPENYICFPHRT